MENEEKILSILGTLSIAVMQIQNGLQEVKDEQVKIRAEIAEIRGEVAEIKTEQVKIRAEIQEIKNEQFKMGQELKEIIVIQVKDSLKLDNVSQKIDGMASKLELMEAVTKDNVFEIVKLKVAK